MTSYASDFSHYKNQSKARGKTEKFCELLQEHVCIRTKSKVTAL